MRPARELPAHHQTTFDELAFPLRERLVAAADAFAGADVERPAVLGAGQRLALEREVRDVGRLVRAATVEDTPAIRVAVDEQAAAIALDASRLADLEAPRREHVVPCG